MVMVSEEWKNKSNNREKRNKDKWKDFELYKKHILSLHKKEWYGNFIDSDVCCACHKSIMGWFNLHVHHLSYDPNTTCLIHALCHTKEFSISEKTFRMKHNKS